MAPRKNRCLTICPSKFVIAGLVLFVFCVILYMREMVSTRQQYYSTEPQNNIVHTTHKNNVEQDLSGRGRILSMPTRIQTPTYSSTTTTYPQMTQTNDSTHSRGIPINIRTSGSYNNNYTQVGFLSNAKDAIIPLHGRIIMPNRNKWQYYTMSERNNIKLPVSVKGKSCMNQYGCDKIYDGDTIYVEGYGNIFRATIYDNDVLRYIPIV